LYEYGFRAIFSSFGRYGIIFVPKFIHNCGFAFQGKEAMIG
jgi:hypothetical protein